MVYTPQGYIESIIYAGLPQVTLKGIVKTQTIHYKACMYYFCFLLKAFYIFFFHAELH